MKDKRKKATQSSEAKEKHEGSRTAQTTRYTMTTERLYQKSVPTREHPQHETVASKEQVPDKESRRNQHEEHRKSGKDLPLPCALSQDGAAPEKKGKPMKKAGRELPALVLFNVLSPF